MTASEETKVAQMQDDYEIRITELEAELANSVPVEKVQGALDCIIKYGGFDGAHHKDWVLDQVVRTLIDDEIKYNEWVALAKSGEEGENTYDYSEGIAP